MGKKSIYTPALKEKICSYLEDGLTKEDAATLSGIHRTTLFDWLNKIPDFANAVEKSVQTFKLANLKIIAHAAKPKQFGGGGSWQAAGWLLERKFNREFSALQKTEHSFDQKMVHEIAGRIITVIRKIAPDVCPHCKTNLNISPRLAEELLALSGKISSPT